MTAPGRRACIRSLLVSLLLLGRGRSAGGDDIGLICVGEVWSYRKGTEAPPPAWTWPEFVPVGWSTGRSGFGSAGWYEATHLPDMPGRYVSLYLRRPFLLPDPAAVVWLTLRIDYDGGFIAYLNGVEVARRGLPGDPGSPVAFDAVASPHAAGSAEEIDLGAAIGLLRPGLNVFAIEGHAGSAHAYRYTVTPELVANFTRGPFLQDMTSRGVTVVWRTPVPANSCVEYGPGESLAQRVIDLAPVTTHVVRLTGLEPATSYLYRVRSAASGKAGASSPARFRTFDETGPLSFIVTADNGYGSAAQYALADVMRANRPDIVFVAGDVAYPAFTPGLADLRCFSVYRDLMREVPFYFALGNHELMPDGGAAYLEAFHLPVNPATGTEHFYSFDAGDAHFAVLNTDPRYGGDLHEGTVQGAWLDADLAGTDRPWKFLLFHNTIRSSGPHRHDDYDLDGVADPVELRESVGVLAARHGVALIFTGHDHTYERLGPVAGVHTVVAGGGGARLYGQSGALDPATAQFWSRHSCVAVALARDELCLRALDEAGAQFDGMSIRRRPPAAMPAVSSWHTPVVEAGGEPLDGNIPGQTFDLVGVPIPAVAGAHANLGRAYVNNDATHLYVGLEQVMVRDDQVALLFVAAPRLGGVSGLAGLGDGATAGTAQGADALDLLERLEFVGFRPAIACLVGDELADGQSRQFSRPGSSLCAGQGVFRLDSAFSDAPDARLQQFNRSPQSGSVPDEQDADFIEIAIPLSAIGGAGPGEIIEMGAVVAATGDGAVEPGGALVLDPGYLGRQLELWNADAARLTGVPVQLATDPRLDSDRDGAPDAEELVAGTDPWDPGSVFRVWLTRPGNGPVCVHWTAVPGRRYRVQYARQPGGSFAELASPDLPRQAEATEESVVDPLIPGVEGGWTRLYRVLVEAD